MQKLTGDVLDKMFSEFEDVMCALIDGETVWVATHDPRDGWCITRYLDPTLTRAEYHIGDEPPVGCA